MPLPPAVPSVLPAVKFSVVPAGARQGHRHQPRYSEAGPQMADLEWRGPQLITGPEHRISSSRREGIEFMTVDPKYQQFTQCGFHVTKKAP